MTASDVIILSVFALAVIVVLFFFISRGIMHKKKAKSSSRLQSYHKKRKGLISTPTYLTFFRVLDKFPLTQQAVRRLNIQLTSLGFFDSIESRVATVRAYVSATALQGFILIFGAVLLRDPLLTITFLVVTVGIKETFIYSRIDAYYLKIYKQLQTAIADLRQAYIRLNSVADALNEVSVGNLLVTQFTKLRSIMGAPNGEDLLDEFYVSAPIKSLQTLAGVCYNIERYGDTLKTDGQSSFATSLQYIASEVSFEILSIQRANAAFKSLRWIPFVPIFFGPILQVVLTSIIPATATVLNGPIGFVSRVIYSLSAMLVFIVVSNATRSMVIKYDDRNKRITKQFQHRWAKYLVRALLPRNTDRAKKKLMALKNALSRQAIEHVYLKKANYAAITFVSLIVAIALSLLVGYQALESSIESNKLSSTFEWTAEERETMLAIDRQWIRGDITSQAELERVLQRSFRDMLQTKVYEQASRIMDKKDILAGVTFHWWMLLICVFAAFIAYLIPDIELKYRNWLIKNEAEEDVLQLQTIITILMDTSFDTLDVLEWLAKHSRVHKHILIDAYHEYPSDPILALDRLRARASVPEFLRLVDKLKSTVYQSSMLEIFADLVAERQYLMSKREIEMDAALKRRRGILSPVSMIPAVLTVAATLIIPIIVIAVAELTSTFANLPT